MTKSDVKTFLRLLNCENIAERESWVTASCPLARWTHAKHRDVKPSFGVSVSTDKPSVFTCFSCAPEAKNLYRLLFDLERLSGVGNKPALEFLCGTRNSEKLKPDTLEVPEFAADARPRNARKFPYSYLPQFPLLAGDPTVRAANVRKWLYEIRRIRLDVFRDYGVRYWKTQPYAVAFPMTLRDETVSVISIRKTNRKLCFRISDNMLRLPKGTLPTPSTSGAWFGAHLVDLRKPVIICEGEIDCMRLASLGITNAISGGGTQITKAQIAQLCVSDVIIGFDADRAGVIAAQTLGRKLSQSFNVSYIDWSLVGCKDAGELQCKYDAKFAVRGRRSRISYH